MRRGFGGPSRTKSSNLCFGDTQAPRRYTSSGPSLPRDYQRRASEPTYGPEWAAVRAIVLKRDNYTCTNPRCRVVFRPPKHGRLDAHHIKPREQGGPDTPSNLRTLCKPCHALEHKHLERMGYGQPKGRR